MMINIEQHVKSILSQAKIFWTLRGNYSALKKDTTNDPELQEQSTGL